MQSTQLVPDPHLCLVCGKGLSRPKQKYCSPQCHGEADRGKPRALRRSPVFKTCPTCKKDFEVGRRTGKLLTNTYCSRECSGEAQRKYLVCQHCGKDFRSKRRSGDRLYCSRECYGESRAGRGKLDLVCGQCGKDFSVPQRRGKRQFCSITCQQESPSYRLTGERNHNWKGGTFISNGYVYEQSGPHYIRQHVRIMEGVIGRKLERGENVHHVNGDTLNNDPSNLMLLTTSEHSSLHHYFMHEFMRVHQESGDLEAITRAFIDSLKDPATIAAAALP